MREWTRPDGERLELAAAAAHGHALELGESAAYEDRNASIVLGAGELALDCCRLLRQSGMSLEAVVAYVRTKLEGDPPVVQWMPTVVQPVPQYVGDRST